MFLTNSDGSYWCPNTRAYGYEDDESSCTCQEHSPSQGSAQYRTTKGKDKKTGLSLGVAQRTRKAKNGVSREFECPCLRVDTDSQQYFCNLRYNELHNSKLAAFYWEHGESGYSRIPLCMSPTVLDAEVVKAHCFCRNIAANSILHDNRSYDLLVQTACLSDNPTLVAYARLTNCPRLKSYVKIMSDKTWVSLQEQANLKWEVDKCRLRCTFYKIAAGMFALCFFAFLLGYLFHA